MQFCCRTHRIAGFAATADIRKLAEAEDAILKKYNYSRFQYGNDASEYAKTGDWSQPHLENFLFSKRGMSPEDAYYLSSATFKRMAKSKLLCISAINEAIMQTGKGRNDIMSAISKYAFEGRDTEAVPEAVADVMFHGDKASWASKAVYNAFNELLN